MVTTSQQTSQPMEEEAKIPSGARLRSTERRREMTDEQKEEENEKSQRMADKQWEKEREEGAMDKSTVG